MPAQDAVATPQLSAVHRYFEFSLYLLLLTSVLTLVSTGKLDLVSILVPPAALMVKGFRWWRGPNGSGRGPELSHRAATWLVLAWKTAGWIGVDRWLLPAVGTPWRPGRLFPARIAGGRLPQSA